MGDWRRSAGNRFIDLVGGAYLGHLVGKLHAGQRHPLATQERLYQRFRRSLAGTAIDRELGLSGITSYRDYVKRVPPRDYDFYRPLVERVVAGEPDVLYHGETRAFLVSSGTSGYNSKTIPCNRALALSFQDLVRGTLGLAIAQPDLQLSLTSAKILWGSKPVIDRVRGIPRGYVSGLLAMDTPAILRPTMFPGPETLTLDDWDRKIDSLFAQTARRDVRLLAAIPGYAVQILRDVCRRAGVERAGELWPNLRTLVYSGTSIGAHRRVIDELVGRPMWYLGAHIATEAPIGLQLGPNRGSPELSFKLDSVLLSFRDVDHPDRPCLAIDELQLGGEYYVNTGTPNGFLQYAMDDHIKVASIGAQTRYVVQGRAGTSLNLAGEKVTHGELLAAVDRVQAQTGVALEHFFVYPAANASLLPGYCWVFVVAQACPVSAGALSAAVDEALAAVSTDYAEARFEGGGVAPATVTFMPSTVLRRYFESQSNAGQLKIQSVFPGHSEFVSFAARIAPDWTAPAGP